ncbi:LD-carboxypeptidase [Paenibacillus doosanensis]|uniref:Murein peptide carboxypeptidase n=1 Tax=Paenibacillus konkukensis TaxID=2020716 RepID=A0ABY4RWW7_9BACL|nr:MULTISPECIES: LD-carboxypeptidase [Paenibacillus]MCS7460707.1 LD-carboxypeptidase [Paenibacillus doosanensis]UQZ85889.1 putative murein peptide carboxypeptidase [Paenibacillus konkukensis]
MAIHPPLLQPGDTIGIVSPGSPLPADQINLGITILKSMGFQVITGNYVYASNGFLAGTDRQRAADVMSMFANPAVKLILPARGGVGVAGILPYLDYRFISANPKIVSGYSDVTVLLNTLYQNSDLLTFSSLMLLNFRMDTPAYNYDQFFGMVSSASVPKFVLNPPGIPLVGKVPGRVSGTLIGGNLTSLTDTLGTPYEIDARSRILFLEETHEPINKVYRMLNHLKLAGKFNDCVGIVMGECTECGVSYGKSYDDLINDFIVPLGKPLLTNLSAAHGTYKAAVPIGALAHLDTQSSNPSLAIMEPTVSAPASA